jgi:flagellar hook-length control protein FliK
MTSILSNLLLPGAAGEPQAAVSALQGTSNEGGKFAQVAGNPANSLDFMNLLVPNEGQQAASSGASEGLLQNPSLKNVSLETLASLLANSAYRGEASHFATEEEGAASDPAVEPIEVSYPEDRKDGENPVSALTVEPATANFFAGASPSSQKLGVEAPAKDMKRVLADNAISESTPILLVLTGKLERLVPQSLPSVILNNEFIKDSLATNDLEGFLNQPTTLGNILESFDVPPKEMQDIAAQLDLNTVVTPNEFLKAINVDPQQISSELQILKDNLPLEGLRSYIERGERLTGTKSKPETETTSGPNLAAGAASGAPQGVGTSPASDARSQSDDGSRSPRHQSGEIGVANAFAAQPSQDPFVSIDQRAKDGFQDALATQQNTVSNVDSDPTLEKSDADQPEWLKFTAERVSDEIQKADRNMSGSSSGQQFANQGQSLDLERMSFFKLESEQTTDESGSASFESSLGDMTAQPLFHQSHKVSDVVVPAKPSLHDSNPAQIVSQKVVDNAVILLNEGGGTIRVDFKTDTLGQVDLAIQVKDNNVELKIIAANDSARDMLATEMPKLREALSAQNITLNKAEVGLSNHSQHSHFSGNAFNSFNNQNQQNNNQNQSSGTSSNGFLTPKFFKPAIASKVYAPRQHHGSISVLA